MKFIKLFDADETGKWGRKVAHTRWHVIHSHEWDEDDNPGYKYTVDLSEIDLTDLERAQEAARSCGWEIRLNKAGKGLLLEGVPLHIEVPYTGVIMDDPKIVVRALVEAMHDFGAKAPLGQWNGNNRGALRKLARDESLQLDDPQAHEEAMGRPVNALGSTAREYARGDIVSAIKRGVESGNQAAKLMDKMYRAAKGHTLGGAVIKEYTENTEADPSDGADNIKRPR
jgi:hypothetical protein